MTIVAVGLKLVEEEEVAAVVTMVVLMVANHQLLVSQNRGLSDFLLPPLPYHVYSINSYTFYFVNLFQVSWPSSWLEPMSSFLWVQQVEYFPRITQ